MMLKSLSCPRKLIYPTADLVDMDKISTLKRKRHVVITAAGRVGFGIKHLCIIRCTCLENIHVRS